MANLETLELTINANANSASQGLSQLIGSLSSLSKGVGKAVGALKNLNTELARLKGFSGMKLPGMISGTTSGGGSVERTIRSRTKEFKAQASVLKEFKNLAHFKSWMYGPNPLPTITNTTGGTKGMLSDAELRKQRPEWFIEPGSKEWNARVAARNASLAKRGNQLPIASKPSTLDQFRDDVNANRNQRAIKSIFGRLNAKPDYSNLGDFVNQKLGIGAGAKSAEESAKVFEQTASLTERLSNAWNKLKGNIKDGAKQLKDILPKFNALHRVMRLASTMLLRMGLRAFFKGIGEGFNNYYQYSKNIGGSFAKEMDGLSSAYAQLKNQLGAAVSTGLSAVIPIINSVASAAITAFNAVSQLFALLSGSSTWSKATAQVTAFDAAAKKAGGGGGGMNELLAKFDELNIIANEGGGGGGGSALGEDFANMFEEIADFDDEIVDLVNWIEDHMAIINGLIATIAASLLGLPASVSIGIGLIVTGVTLGLDAGKSMATDGITTENILKLVESGLVNSLGGALIGGKVATLLGGSAATGAMIGLTIGFAITLVAMSIGIEEGVTERHYGDLEFSREEIQRSINQLYTFTFSPTVDLVKAKITGLDELAKTVKSDIEEVKIQIGSVSVGQADAEALARKVKNLVSHTQDLMKGMKEYSILINAELDTPVNFEALEGWDTLSEILGDLGDQIGTILSDNVVDAFEKPTLEKLLGSLTRISQAVTTAEGMEKYTAASYEVRDAFVNGEMTKESFITYVDEIEKLNESTMKTARAAINKEAENLSKEIAGLEQAKEEGYTTWNGKSIDTALEAAKTEYAKYDTMEKRQELADKLYKTWVGTSTEGQAEDIISGYHAILDDVSDKARMRDYMKTNDKRLTDDVSALDDIVTESVAYMTGQDKKFVIKATELFDITGWDLLSDELRANLFTVLHENLGYSWEDAIRMVKETYNLSIADLLDGMNWEEMSSDKKQYIAEVIAGLFSSEEIDEFVANAGENLGNEFADGITSALAKKRETELKQELQKKYPDAFERFKKTLGNWKFAVPMIDMFGIENSVDIMGRTLEEFGEDAEYIIENWHFVSPGIDQKNPLASLADMKKFVTVGGFDLETIVKNWNLVSPAVTGINTEDSIYAIKELSRQTGLDISTIIRNWDLIAPKIDKKNVESSVDTISEIINSNSEDWYTTLENLGLYVPDIETSDTFSNKVTLQAEELEAKLIEIFGADLVIKDVKTPNRFGVTAKEEAAKTIDGMVTLVGGRSLTTKDVGTPSGFGSAAKKSADSAMANITDALGNSLVVSDVDVPEGFGDDVTKEAKGVYDGLAEIFEDPISVVLEVTATASGSSSTGSTSIGGVASIAATALQNVTANATGAYDIPRGDLFIANEAGAELVGSIGGKTSVANQDQIIEGIQRGVAEGQAEQNALLAQQNELLRALLEKDATIQFGASAAFGRVAKQSLDMYGSLVGG